jgi:dTDP-4-amino-4,6-dideoxygalactose transaminase
MTTAIASPDIIKSINTTEEKLAAEGGPAAVTSDRPESFLLGPQEIGEEEIDAVTAVLRSKTLFRFADQKNSVVGKFEELFKEKTQVRHALAVNSGTSALVSGLIGIGVSQGDEVLVPAYTYIATAAAVLAVGAFPVMVEIDASFTMDPEDLERKITPRSTAVIPVHMRGVPCDMEKIMKVARAHNLKVLEDCAQANGGSFRGRPLGSWGDAGAFSMQHYKIITAGEGGVVVTQDEEIHGRAAIYHDSAYAFWMENQGTENEQQRWKDLCFLGQNFRQSELHGALALEQLKKRDRILERTRAIKKRFWEACEEIPGVEMEHVRDREGDCGISLALFMDSPQEVGRLARLLKAEGVQCGTKFSKDIPDRHFVYHWNYVLEKRTPHRSGFPWLGTDRHCQVEYSQEMCPQSLAWVERSAVFPITQVMTDPYVDDVCRAIRKVARAF